MCVFFCYVFFSKSPSQVMVTWGYPIWIPNHRDPNHQLTIGWPSKEPTFTAKSIFPTMILSCQTRRLTEVPMKFINTLDLPCTEDGKVRKYWICRGKRCWSWEGESKKVTIDFVFDQILVFCHSGNHEKRTWWTSSERFWYTTCCNMLYSIQCLGKTTFVKIARQN